MKKYGLLVIYLLLIVALTFVACGGREEPQMAEIDHDMFAEADEPDEPEPEPEPEPDQSPPAGMAVSLLTGLYIDEQAAARRPFAVVFNNESRAMPQSGLMQADVIYEVLAEGVTTRLVAIFQDFDAGMIGPVRSSRDYMAQIANDHGAVFVHHGASPTGYSRITSLGLMALDGMRYDGTVFWRDPDRRRDRGLEHSSYTAAPNLLEIAETRGFNMDAPANLGIFEFFDQPTELAGAQPAVELTIAAHSAIFRYNPESEAYYKYIWGNPHMDDYVGEQVSVTNVLVQVTNIHVIAGDEAGRRNVAIIGSGHGYLATLGGYTRVYWEKPDATTPTRWMNEDGSTLQLNRGRTWISIVNTSPIFEGAMSP
ncbi:MAG: DUF3048 domain-containing protein [Defluviitaleaceae bacterium]|nr:DUF3048 domain-containing protein [Defluviitaleaceae bacterium]